MWLQHSDLIIGRKPSSIIHHVFNISAGVHASTLVFARVRVNIARDAGDKWDVAVEILTSDTSPALPALFPCLPLRWLKSCSSSQNLNKKLNQSISTFVLFISKFSMINIIYSTFNKITWVPSFLNMGFKFSHDSKQLISPLQNFYGTLTPYLQIRYFRENRHTDTKFSGFTLV